MELYLSFCNFPQSSVKIDVPLLLIVFILRHICKQQTYTSLRIAIARQMERILSRIRRRSEARRVAKLKAEIPDFKHPSLSTERSSSSDSSLSTKSASRILSGLTESFARKGSQSTSGKASTTLEESPYAFDIDEFVSVFEDTGAVAEESQPVVEEALPPSTDPRLEKIKTKILSLSNGVLKPSSPVPETTESSPGEKEAKGPRRPRRRKSTKQSIPQNETEGPSPVQNEKDSPKQDPISKLPEKPPANMAPIGQFPKVQVVPKWQPVTPTPGAPPARFLQPSLESSHSPAVPQKPPHVLRPQAAAFRVRKTAAFQAVNANMPKHGSSPSFVAIGSGLQVEYIVNQISRIPLHKRSYIRYVSTGAASEHLMATYNLQPIISLVNLPANAKIDVYFGTADEIDDEGNCIKGRLGSAHIERLVALRAEKFVCVVDSSACIPSIANGGGSIPVEITPESYITVFTQLKSKGATVTIRIGEAPSMEPAYTRRGTIMLDTKWPPLQNPVGAVQTLAEMLKKIPGVVDHGLFHGDGWIRGGRPNVVYITQKDGIVDVRVPFGSSS
ncbi:hypothetical protein ABW21_db0207636 [Orbilia brochopaga]|nr:hypothetical protein ABW21_db0207636 [Drechslerella brochopaga]